MQFDLVMQKNNENTFLDNLVECFREKPSKVYMLYGDLKESGFRLIEEELIDTKIKLFVAMGIDKKNTTKTLLDSILEYSDDVYVYSNNGEIEFNSNITVFEYSKYAYMFFNDAKITEDGIKNNLSIYLRLKFDFNDKDQKDDYKKKLKEILKNIQELDQFIKLDKNVVEKLVNDKEIFSTRQYNHNVMSISELLGKSKQPSEEKEDLKKDDDIVGDVAIPKIDLSDISLDIDMTDAKDTEDKNQKDEIINKEEKNKENVKNKKENEDIEIEKIEDKDIDLTDLDDFKLFQEELNIKDEEDTKKQNLNEENTQDDDLDLNETFDINDMLFSEADVELNVDKKEQNNKAKDNILDEDKDEVLSVKKVNFNNVTNYIYELPNKPSKGQDINNLKIPNYIKTMIPAFFEITEKGRNIEIDGNMYKIRHVNVEIVDVKNDTKYVDRDAKIMQKQGQSYLYFSIDMLKNIDYKEKDIARIIKLSSDVYHIEIISQDMQEYNIWEKLCNQKFKASTRKYGMM